MCGGWHSITRQGAGRQKAGSSQSAASLASSLASSFASSFASLASQAQQQQQHTVRVKNHWRSIFVTSLKGWEKSPPSSSSNVAFTPPEFCGDPMGRWCSGGVLPRGRLVGDCARPRPESRQRCPAAAARLSHARCIRPAARAARIRTPHWIPACCAPPPASIRQTLERPAKQMRSPIKISQPPIS
eukprot:COSAG01_NODE_16374_length_1241_cov_3.827496_1_plen_186_part_00